MTFKILTDDTLKVIHWSNVRTVSSLTILEWIPVW
jgi:hypothetical protein